MNKDEKALNVGESVSVGATKAFIVVLTLGAVVMCVLGPRLVDIIMTKTSPLVPDAYRYWIMLIGGYILATILFVFLYLMYKLVCRIELGEVFVMQNVRALGLLSNLVFLACLITFVIGITCTYMIFVITVAAAFMTPIISVIRYAFARAVAMKDELDLTV